MNAAKPLGGAVQLNALADAARKRECAPSVGVEPEGSSGGDGGLKASAFFEDSGEDRQLKLRFWPCPITQDSVK